jgi:hypothetical protein
MREPGNTSGVARVTFPNEFGTYLISYIRAGNHSITVLGEMTIHVPPAQRESTGATYDTEGYSPRFRASITKRLSCTSMQDTLRTPGCENESFAKLL